MRILYLDIDTLRPDHLGCYGYGRNTSPNIDRVAAQGVRFDRLYCSDAPCLPSRTALMTGRFGIHTGVVGHGGTAADMRVEGASRGGMQSYLRWSLPAYLARLGMYTSYVGGFAERHSAFHYYSGFREIHDTGMGGMESAEHVSPAALDWIERCGSKDNWYLHVNYWDPHTPYRAPASFGNPFEGQPLPGWLTPELLRRHREMPGPHTAREVNMFNSNTDPAYPRHPGEIANMEDMRRLYDGYDCGIRYADDHVGKILAELDRKGVLDDTAIIISSDHGENLGELGIYAEHATADHVTCRIPTIIKWPGCRAGHVDRGLHYNLDLLPTLAALLGYKPKETWEGASFAPAVTGGTDCGRDHLVLSQCAHVCQRSVIQGDWLWMRTWHCGYHLFPQEMLFNIADDPHEQRDLASVQPDKCRESATIYANWLSGMMKTMPSGYHRDPMDTVMAEGGPSHARGRLSAYCERLRATGRAAAADELSRRYPSELESQARRS